MSRGRPTRRGHASSAELSIADARRLALSAQGLLSAHRGGVAARVNGVFNAVGVVQIDSVNVLVRSQELPLFARIGAHDRSAIGVAVDRGELFEYWAHEASLVPVDLHPYLRWRMTRPHPWLRGFYESNRRLVENLHAKVRDDGPVKAADVSMRRGPKGTWWDWDDAKRALEYLFYAGRLTTRRRDTDFARVYDLPERVIPKSVLRRTTPTEHDARRELLLRAAKSLGVATHVDLADYFRQVPRDCAAALRSLVDDGALREVRVEGWAKPAYASSKPTYIPAKPAYISPKTAYASSKVSVRTAAGTVALLSPFDSLVWHRERTERLFNFHYRIELYTPRAKRKFGYYVLPVLVGDALVGRLDVQRDTAARTLHVHGAYREPGTKLVDITAPVAGELHAMARWLGLDTVAVARRGNWSAALAAETKRRSR